LSKSYEFYYDDVTVTSFINIRHGNVAVEIISHLLLFVCCGQTDVAQMSFSLRCVQYGDRCFTRPAIHFWREKFAHGRERVVDEEEPGRHVVSTTDATIAAVDSLMRSNRRVMG